MKNMKKMQSGFTLVEIAIVLVIIGLLLGGVLKGQELIAQAKIKNVANDLNGLTASIYSYQDRYKRFPGDDPGATRWALITAAGDGDNVVEGNYNSTTNTDESRLFWAELRLAGFVAGATDSLANAATQPVNAAGGIMGVQHGGLGLSGLVICSGSLPTKIAQSIDSQFDDGNSKTGSVRAMLETTPPTQVGATPADKYDDNGTNLYVLCKNV
ncbi:prepilin-type N-terminal cleavage/methylation domain-containing protein [Propionivibrio sp.]|jgi:prepilin-type N-terminal cleavage/methylation domain-containing protein|uniref:prepilin-type N-terminal cleavage/methylation domain-containing protein n=1 Tax=Propionivibrio sp. TaxID=2212460 RepID=UPI0039E276B8